jgi:hypothetical protein
MKNITTEQLLAIQFALINSKVALEHAFDECKLNDMPILANFRKEQLQSVTESLDIVNNVLYFQ